MMESEQKDDMKQVNQPNLNGATMQVGDEGHANSTNSEASSTSSSPRSHFHKVYNVCILYLPVSV